MPIARFFSHRRQAVETAPSDRRMDRLRHAINCRCTALVGNTSRSRGQAVPGAKASRRDKAGGRVNREEPVVAEEIFPATAFWPTPKALPQAAHFPAPA